MLVPIVLSLSESFCPTLQPTHRLIDSFSLIFPRRGSFPLIAMFIPPLGSWLPSFTIVQLHREVTASSTLSIKTWTALHPLSAPTHSASDQSCPGISRARLGVVNHLLVCFISEGKLARSEEQHKAANRVDKDPHRKLVFADYICEACGAGQASPHWESELQHLFITTFGHSVKSTGKGSFWLLLTPLFQNTYDITQLHST